MRISDWSSDVCSSDLRSWWTACRRRWAGQHHWRAISSGKESGLWPGLFNALSGVASVSLIVFPAIDLKGGQVVRLAEGDMDRADRTRRDHRSEEHPSELQSLMRISYSVLCLKKQHHKT